ncbi:MAG: oligoribonuclease [Acidimicrobiales bacterium]
MDLEMSGLDVHRHVILEVATLVTDDELVVLEEGPDLVVATSAEQLAAMDEFVREMHTRSGLLEEIASSTVTLEEAGDATLDFIRRHVPQPRSVPLAGNSIGTDRRFLAAYLPAVDDYLHYRSVDVSTVKELAGRWFPRAAKKAPRKAGGHRAMDDIRESVAELAYYRSAVFREPETETAAEAPAQEPRSEPPEKKPSSETE